MKSWSSIIPRRAPTSTWMLCACPSPAKNKLAAERYIDFMLSVDEAYGAPAIANAEYTYYASPNRAVIESEDYIAYMNDIKEGGYDLMYPAAEDAVPTSSYRNLKGDKLLLLNNLWEELKSDITVSGGIYAICGVIIFSLTGLGIFLYVRKRRRKKYTDTLWE